MLWAIFGVMFSLWLAGMATSHTLYGFIHILLVVALAALLIQVIFGRRPKRTSAHSAPRGSLQPSRPAPGRPREDLPSPSLRTPETLKRTAGLAAQKFHDRDAA
jgi:hypothetical protein